MALAIRSQSIVYNSLQDQRVKLKKFLSEFLFKINKPTDNNAKYNI